MAGGSEGQASQIYFGVKASFLIAMIRQVTRLEALEDLS